MGEGPNDLGNALARLARAKAGRNVTPPDPTLHDALKKSTRERYPLDLADFRKIWAILFGILAR